MNFQDIPKIFKFPSSYHRVDMGWKHLELNLDLFRGMGLNMDPDFHRGYVWTQQQQIQYIEYILKGGTGGKEIYFNHPDWYTGNKSKDFVLVDGKQRIHAVQNFMDNKIRAFDTYYKDFKGHLPLEARFVFNVASIENYNDVIQWYINMNSGGTNYTTKDIQRAKKCLRK